MNFDNTYVTIDLDAIRENFQMVEQKAGVPALAVLKADAYGHGAVAVAKCLQDICGYFGVATVTEALELRKAGIQTPILVFGGMPAAAFSAAVDQQIRPVIYRYEDALALSETAVMRGVDARFHFAVDTGMSRIGFQVTEEDADICKKICELPGLVPEGVFSHFASADIRDLTNARMQAQRFDAFLEMLTRRGVKLLIRHLSNSAGAINFDKHYDMVRAGIVLYGMHPSGEFDRSFPLKPVLQWRCRITHVKTLEAGRQVGYGSKCVLSRPTVVATLPVGYADGYKRSLSSSFYVLIHGQKAPILGKICMDQVMVDATDIPNVQVGDWVTLIGKDGDLTITPEEIGETAHTFHYEFVCNISRRVPRYYLQGGRLIHQVHYLLDAYQ